MQFLQFSAARHDTGAVLPRARVTVYLPGTLTKAALFNLAGAPIGNPVSADDYGAVGFRAANGAYDASISSEDGGYTVPGIFSIQLYDLTELDGKVNAVTNAAAAVAAAVNDPGFIAVAADMASPGSAIRQAGPVLGQIVAAGAMTNAFSSVTTALAGVSDGQYANVRQAGLYAADTYLRSSGALALQFSTPMANGVAWAAKVAAEGALAEQMPVTPLFWIQMADGKFTDGQMVPNRIGPMPSRNLMQRPNGTQGAVNGAVITPGQPDPWGGTTAFRVQLPASNSYVQLVNFLTTVTPSEAGDYRFVMQAKSNVGAGNQNFTLRKDLGSPSVTTAVTEAAWVEVVFTVTMGNNNYIAIYNPSGTTPLDLIISMPTLSRSEVRLPAHPIAATGGLVGQRLSAPGGMTIDGNGNLAGAYKGRINFTEDGIATRTFAAMTMWVTFKKTGTSAAFQFNAPFWARTSGQTDLILGTESDLFSFRMPGLVGFNPDPSWSAYGDGFITLCLRFDATRSVASLGSVELATGTGTGGVPFQIPWAYFFGGFNDNYAFPGLVNSWGCFDSYLEDDQLSRVVRAANRRAQLYGNALGAENILFTAGDSLTNGALATGGVGFTQQIATNLGLKKLTEAVSGTDIYAAMTNPRYANFKRKISQCVADGKRAIVHILLGSNNTVVTAATYQTYIDSFKALGTSDNPVKVVVGTIPDRGSRTPSDTAIYNTMVRGLAVDGLADYAAIANIGGAGAALNTTYFSSDQIHPNTAGHALMTPVGQAAIAALRR